MWLLGAGASANANVPTAYDLIWEFKRDIYCSRERVPVALLRDLSDPGVRVRLQEYFASQRDLPPEGSPDEYAAHFEAAYPSEADRRQLLDPKMRGARASYGHLAIAALMVMEQLRIVWTTNFDTCVEDGHTYLTGSTAGLVTATPEAPDLAEQAMTEGRWPLQVKLHGDFRYRRLRNTPEELRQQDAVLRRLLVSRCHEFGLAVVGYSGRDESIMEALREALNGPTRFPAGLVWFYRPSGALLPAVEQLVAEAVAKGVDAHLLPVPTFDELGSDLLVLHDLPQALDEQLKQRRGGRPPVPSVLVERDGVYPLVRFNALPIDVPPHCRLVDCGIGGAADVSEAVETGGRPIVAARRAQGVLAFGRDDDVRATFESFAIQAFDIFPIDGNRLRFDSAEVGLLYEALLRGLVRHLPLRRVREDRRSHALVIDPEEANDPRLKGLRDALRGPVVGTIPRTTLPWAEGVLLQLDRRLDTSWLCIEPIVTAPRSGEPTQDALRGEFLRERRARRYNVLSNDILDAWRTILTAGGESAEYSTFDCTDGVDAVFRIHGRSAFSGREKR
jgi:hypothetical protein